MPNATLPAIDEIIETFSFFDDWDDRFAFLLDLGKKIQPLPEEDHNEANRVHGCQSTVWLKMTVQDQHVDIQAESDAHIVNGLIAILLSAYANQTPEQILKMDIKALLTQLDLEDHLSPTRRNGLHSMIQRIHTLAQAYK